MMNYFTKMYIEYVFRYSFLCKIVMGILDKLKDTNPRPGKYLTHAHSHVTRAVPAMDTWFALIGAHRYGIAVGPLHGQSHGCHCAPW